MVVAVKKIGNLNLLFNKANKKLEKRNKINLITRKIEINPILYMDSSSISRLPALNPS